MDDIIRILIFAEGELLILLNKFFKENNNYEVVGSTFKLSELDAYLLKYKKLVVLLNTYNKSLDEKIINVIKENNVKIIVMCNNVKEGFGLLGKGADDMCTIPNDIQEHKSFFASISIKINKLYKEYDDNSRVLKNSYNRNVKKVIAIGSSTGGTECILQILKELPTDAPPVLIVQHMPPVFTKLYSKRLNKECKMTVWEAKDGDTLQDGLALIAPGNQHMRVSKKNNNYVVNCANQAPVSGHIPSVDVLFNSVAEFVGRDAIGIILTGMGKDGAEGILKMRKAGAFTIGQDEESSVVYGMPKVAYDIGGISIQSKPEKIAKIIMSNI